MGQYVGVKKKSVRKFEIVTGLKLAGEKASFGDSDSEVSNGESTNSANGDNNFQEFSSVCLHYFDTLVGFSEVMDTATSAYDILQTVEVDSFINRSVKKASSAQENIGKWEVYEIRAEARAKVSREMNHLVRQLDRIPMIHDIFLLGLISQFDSFVGSIVRILAMAKPHIIFQSEKVFTASEIFQYLSMEEFRESVLEKEIETVLRGNREEQFKWLEAKIKRPLRENLEVWPAFIEICERRNLFAHTNGFVSSTYLKKCGDAGFKVSVRLGDKLSADPVYLRKAANILLEIGVKLAQTLWRIAFDDPQNHEAADAQLNEIAYQLIYHRNYSLAVDILEFGFSKPMKHPKKSILHMMRINLANAYKLEGRMEKALSVLDAEDWTPLQSHFQLCAAAVKDDLPAVSRLMSEVSTDAIEPGNYFEWPVFLGLRKMKGFVDLIRTTFGNDVVAMHWHAPAEKLTDGAEVPETDSGITQEAPQASP